MSKELTETAASREVFAGEYQFSGQKNPLETVWPKFRQKAGHGQKTSRRSNLTENNDTAYIELNSQLSLILVHITTWSWHDLARTFSKTIGIKFFAAILIFIFFNCAGKKGLLMKEG